MKHPNFFIVGAEKSATTSLYFYLKQHPDVFFPEDKEIGYYSGKYNVYPHNNPNGVGNDKRKYKNLEEYLSLFANADHKIVGDSTVNNLYFDQTAYDIKNDFPESKILISLRNPIDRAFSAYMHLVRANQEYLTFEQALKEESKRREKNYTSLWNYIEGGKYYKKVKTYLDVFGQENVRIIFYEDIKNDIENVLHQIYGFLNVDSTIEVNTSIKFNVSGTPKSRLLHHIMIKENFIKTTIKPLVPKGIRVKSKNYLYQKNLNSGSVDPETREKLKDVFRDDIQSLERLINKDLSEWVD